MSLSKNVAGLACADVMHPWTNNCLQAHRTILQSSLVGSAQLFVPLILAQYALKLRKKKKKINKEFFHALLVDLIQTISLGVGVCTIFMVSHCVLRYVLGKYTYLSSAYIPGFFSGLSYLVLGSNIQMQILTAYSNAALESFVLKMSHFGLITLNVYTETVFFMITNACLMFVFKAFKLDRTKHSWFFQPDENGPNDGEKSFFETLCKKTKNYIGLGLGFGILSKLIGDITLLMPRNIHKLFKMSTIKPGIFAGSYVAVYELFVYLMNQYFQKDHPIFALPAGFLAGLTYAIDPILSINLSVFINLLQVLYRLADIRILRRLPVDTLLYCLSSATLLHIYLFYPKSVAKVGSKVIKMTSHGRSTIILEAFKNLRYNMV